MASTTTSAPPLSIDLPWLARHGDAYYNTAGELHLTTRERLYYQDDDNSYTHVCKGGESLIDLAILFYRDQLPNAVDCWEILAEYQEDPIVDGSVPLAPNTVIMIPPVSYIREIAMGDSLRLVAESS